jgi:hypothetical protein
MRDRFKLVADGLGQRRDAQNSRRFLPLIWQQLSFVDVPRDHKGSAGDLLVIARCRHLADRPGEGIFPDAFVQIPTYRAAPQRLAPTRPRPVSLCAVFGLPAPFDSRNAGVSLGTFTL